MSSVCLDIKEGVTDNILIKPLTSFRFCPICSDKHPKQDRPTKKVWQFKSANDTAPIIFNLCSGPLSNLLRYRLKGIELFTLTNIRFQSLVFVDDYSVILLNKNEHSLLKDTLYEFENVSDSKVNRSKSSIYYFNNENQRRRENGIFKSALNYKTDDLKNMTYLGVPILGVQWSKFRNKMIKLQLVKIIEGCKHKYICIPQNTVF